MAGSDLYTGTLDLLILKALSWGPMHGYAINKWIRGRTSEMLNVNEGALYPALHRLEAKGWLAEEWGVTERNREAKFYALTPAGRRQLRAEVDRWNEYTRVVGSVLAATSA
jgi:PadR family transcriptional regulator, regulatory protein PadR